MTPQRPWYRRWNGTPEWFFKPTPWARKRASSGRGVLVASGLLLSAVGLLTGSWPIVVAGLISPTVVIFERLRRTADAADQLERLKQFPDEDDD